MIKVISALLDAAGSITTGTFDTLLSLITPGRKTSYDADFLPSGEILSSFNRGFCLTGKKSINIEQSFSNCLVMGGTSSGKSSTILIPSILKMMGNSSFCINDPSGELINKTGGALANAGYMVKSLNYSNPEISEGYNPLHRAKTVSDIQKIAKIIVINSLGQSKDPFWNISSEALISLFSRYVINHQRKEFQTLHNVLHLINTFAYAPEKVDHLIVKTNDDSLISEYKSFVAYGDKTLMGVVATARAALSIFSDPKVALVTSHDTLDFEEFREKKIALFINNSIKDIRYYSVISSIFFEQFWGHIMSRIPDKNELPVFFLTDEASSLFLSSLPVTVSNIRKSKSGILLIYQSYSQLVDAYGNAQAKNIAANCFSKVYMPGVPIDIAQELETTFGKFEYKDEKEISHLRPLMTASEIRQSNEALILCGNYPPIKIKVTPYFNQFKLCNLTKIPPVILPVQQTRDTPLFIQFPE